jgi:PIN domain nuclease of toxin-antitoxin system
MVLLDTHVWLWWLHGDGLLSNSQRVALNSIAENSGIVLSWVSLWEMEMLERKKRVQISIPLKDWMEKATHSSFCTVLPVDREIVLAQRLLPESFHSDPADRLIAATALLSGIPLATFDKRIIDCCKDSMRIWKS